MKEAGGSTKVFILQATDVYIEGIVPFCFAKINLFLLKIKFAFHLPLIYYAEKMAPTPIAANNCIRN